MAYSTVGSGSETETENESTTVPADIAITPCTDIEVLGYLPGYLPGYHPGFRSRHCTAILTVTMLCYALPVTVTNQKFIGIQPTSIFS